MCTRAAKGRPPWHQAVLETGAAPVPPVPCHPRQEEDIETQIAYRQRRRSQAAAAAAAAGQPALLEAAAGGGGGGRHKEQRLRRRREGEEGEGGEAGGGAMEPQHCKLAQRLLARAEAKRARKQPRQ